MAIPGLNNDKCKQRNRVSGLKFSVNTCPVSVRGTGGVTQEVDGSEQGVISVSSTGVMPSTPEEHLEWVRSVQPQGATPLELTDIWVHEIEAASSAFMADRYGYNAPSTLRNIAFDAISGIAFMNSHRTGGMSHQSELPYGRTYAGLYEHLVDKEGKEVHRARIAFFMDRGVHPNGANGPSTDDLHKMINSGSLFDVSVGLHHGEYGVVVCNVCGRDLENDWDCEHYPGTDYSMTDEERDAALAQGIPNGFASFRLENFRLSETSAVYDGAVPNAGFRKVIQRAQNLPSENFQQFAHSYGHLLSDPKVLSLLEEVGDDMSIKQLKDKLLALGNQGSKPVPVAMSLNAPARNVPTEQSEESSETVKSDVENATPAEEKTVDVETVVEPEVNEAIQENNMENNEQEAEQTVPQEEVPQTDAGSGDAAPQEPEVPTAQGLDNNEPAPAGVGSEGTGTVVPVVVPVQQAPVVAASPLVAVLEQAGVTNITDLQRMLEEAQAGKEYRQGLAQEYAKQYNRVHGPGTINADQALRRTQGLTSQEIQEETARNKTLADKTVLNPDGGDAVAPAGPRTERQDTAGLIQQSARRTAAAQGGKTRDEYRSEAKRILQESRQSQTAGKLPRGENIEEQAARMREANAE
jgi:hypothetical protein